MNPKLRNAIIIAGSVVVALIAGWQIANESFALAAAAGIVLLFSLITRVIDVPLDALVAGPILAGYLIGNRGFAQLNIPGLPMLPGEFALGIGLFVSVWSAARTKTTPIRRDLINTMLLIWLAFGSARLWFDFRAHGFLALRDFAILYYALFFFLAQGWWTTPEKRRWIEGGLTFGFAIGAPMFLAFARWPEFFTAQLSLRGTPLIFVKSDVQAGLLIAGTFWFLQRYKTSGRWEWLTLAALNLLGVAMANNRAALVALGGASLWVVVCRDWRTLRPFALIATFGVMMLLLTPFLSRNPWQQSLAYRFYESAASIVDFQGQRKYAAADLDDKPDNNRFRLTWWSAVFAETWAEGRWTGLGFGYDLAQQFTRIYYFDNPDEFNARSPHNFPLTIFGRMGLIGVTALLLCLLSMALRTWRAGHLMATTAGGNPSFSMWVGVWGIFISACFGVVLEGPMGAIVFWTLAGMANASLDEAEAVEATEPSETDRDLRPLSAAPEVQASRCLNP